MKKTVLTVLAVLLLSVMLCGCSGLTFEISELIVPPDPSGKLASINKALHDFAGDDITLRYPKGGDYRSAFVIQDIDGDSKEEAIAFYSTVSEENTNVMHINLIVETADGWRSVSDDGVESGAIGSLEFKDINGDGISEVLVSRTVSSSSTDKLSVFGYSSSGLIPYIFEDYSAYTVCDIIGNGENGLLILSSDSANHSAVAKYFAVSRDGAAAVGECPLDAQAVSYRKPIVSTLPDGRPAVYVDADKGTLGTVTEVVYWHGKGLVDPFVTPPDYINTETLRGSTVSIYDFDRDGIPEIPLLTALPDQRGSTSDDPAYLTAWMKCNDGVLEPTAYALMNYSDGYSLKIDDELRENIAVTKKAGQTERIISVYDSEMTVATEEIFRICAVPKGSEPPSENYEKTAETDQNDIYVLINKNSRYAPSIAELSERIRAID